MGLLNTTIFYGLILTNYTNYSPLKIFPQQTFLSSLTFSDFKLSRFTNTALFFKLQSNLLIEKSHFSRFLKTPIIESRPEIPNYNRKCANPRFPVAGTRITESYFQICSTDFEADMDTVNASGGAFFFKDRDKEVIIIQCHFAYCHAGINGGALFIANADKLSVNFTYFQDCDTGFLANRTFVEEAKGGAIFANCIESQIIGCYFVRCTIDYTKDVERYGGAIYFARCTPVSPQGLDIYLSNFIDCGSIPANTSVDYGGAIFINVINSSDSDYAINITCTNFTNCAYASDGSIIHVEGDTAKIYLMHTGFIRDKALNLDNKTKYNTIKVVNSQPLKQSLLYLYNVSLFDKKLNDAYFYFYAVNCKIGNDHTSLGSIYLTRSKDPVVFLNNNSIDSRSFVNLYPDDKYHYPFIEALNDNQVFKPFATQMATPSVSQSPSPTATINEIPPTTSLLSIPSSDLSQPESLIHISPIQPESSTPDDGGSSNTGSTKSGGLSTAAIVIIIIACIIVVIVIIVVSVLCVRNGRCGNSRNQIFDARTAENDESIRRFTYF